MNIIEISVSDLIPYMNNPRKNDQAVDAVAKSIKEFGFKVPIVIDSEKIIVTGHTRLKAAQELGLEKVPCIIADDLTPEQIKAFRIIDNKTSDLAAWDFEKLDIELEDLNDFNFDMEDFGFDFDNDDFTPSTYAYAEEQSNDTENPVQRKSLAERFLFVPFSVLDSRDVRWQKRKRLLYDILPLASSSDSREQTVVSGSLSGSVPRYYTHKAECEKRIGRTLTHKEFEEKYLSRYIPENSTIANTVSGGILSRFDPVLAELMYYWFCPSGGRIFDPFAGGNVRGIIAGMVGYEYTCN